MTPRCPATRAPFPCLPSLSPKCLNESRTKQNPNQKDAFTLKFSNCNPRRSHRALRTHSGPDHLPGPGSCYTCGLVRQAWPAAATRFPLRAQSAADVSKSHCWLGGVRQEECIPASLDSVERSRLRLGEARSPFLPLLSPSHILGE